MDATKPARSVVIPPPTASTSAFRDAPASSSERAMRSTVSIDFPSSVASMAMLPRTPGTAAITSPATQETCSSYTTNTSGSPESKGAISAIRLPPTTRPAAVPPMVMVISLCIDYKDTGFILQISENAVNLQSVSPETVPCPNGGIGRRAGLKIQCPLKTCRFEPGFGHENENRQHFVAKSASCWRFPVYRPLYLRSSALGASTLPNIGAGRWGSRRRSLWFLVQMCFYSGNLSFAEKS